MKRKDVFFEAGILLLSLLLLPGLVGCGGISDVKATTTPTPTKTTMPTPTATPFVIQRAQVLDFITSLSNAPDFPRGHQRAERWSRRRDHGRCLLPRLPHHDRSPA